MTLSSRIAAAPVEQTGLMLEEAWRFIHGSSHWTGKTIGPGDKFGRFLNAQAYHDAAMMLIDEGALMAAETYDSPGVKAPHVRASAWVQGAERQFAATTPLAIAAAAVKVKERG